MERETKEPKVNEINVETFRCIKALWISISSIHLLYSDKILSILDVILDKGQTTIKLRASHILHENARIEELVPSQKHYTSF